MSKPQHIIDFMESQGYKYDPITDSFIEKEEMPEVLKEIFKD